MDKVAVYRFKVWDHEIGADVWASRMATPEAIKRMNGVPAMSSERLVDSSEIDGNGFYPKKTGT